MESLISSSIPKKELFLRLMDCVESTASIHNTGRLEIIKALDGAGDYSGFREWLGGLAQSYFVPEPPGEIKGKYGDGDFIENEVGFLPVRATGARPGEIIVGTKTQSKNARVRIFSATIPPEKEVLDAIRGDGGMWRRFIMKLGSIEFFEDLSSFEREIWFEDHQVPYEPYFDTVKKLEIEVLQPGTGSFLLVSDSNMELLAKPQSKFPISDVVKMIPGKPSSEGLLGRHTLIFRPGIWKVSVEYKEVEEHTGVIIDVDEGKIVGEAEAGERMLLTFKAFAMAYTKTKGKFMPKGRGVIGFLAPIPKLISRDEIIQKLILDGPGENTAADVEIFKFATRKFTPASFKSLMQKLIRFRPETVFLSTDPFAGNKGLEVYSTDFVLRCTFVFLALHPGTFVPDIQRFVSGLESAFKRMIVTLFEDGFIPVDRYSVALSVISGAFLAQRADGWKSNISLLRKSLDLGLASVEDDTGYMFDIPKGSKITPYVLSGDSKPLEAVSALVDELKSFHGDLAMIRYIVKGIYDGKSEVSNLALRPETMTMEHCVDQHWAPEIVYFYPVDVVIENSSSGKEPFSKLLVKLFSEVTGTNPRRPRREGRTMKVLKYAADFERRDFTKITRRAQKLTLFSRQISSGEMKNIENIKGGGGGGGSGKTYSLKYELDEGWIAGMLGAVYVPGRPPALVSLRPDDPEIFVAIPKPSRNMKKPVLSDERETQVLERFREMLARGLPLNQTSAPVSKLEGAKLVYREGVFYIQDKGGGIHLWEKFRKGKIKLPLLKPVKLTLENGLTYCGRGVVEGADDRLVTLLMEASIPSIRRCMGYLSSKKGVFELPRIGRDGGGTKDPVSIHDVGAYQLLLKISLLYPSALRRAPGNALRFKVPVRPLLNRVYEMVRGFLVETQNIDSEAWGNLGEKGKSRVLWKHQTDAVKEMKDYHDMGRKGSFLDMTVGMGKSLVVLTYLKWLKDTNQLPKYVIYTLPSSAVMNVITEVELMNFNYRVLVPLKTKPKAYRGIPKKVWSCEPEEYAINFITHDHMRFCRSQLSEIMPESVFVIDEVHKALNNSLRTGIALELSHLSQEFIALTGTPLIDNNTYKLIWWLEQIAPFEINTKNFWVGAIGMVSKKVRTGVKVVEKEKVAVFDKRSEGMYQSLVSPGLGGQNAYARQADLQKAMDVCYNTATKGMVKEIRRFLKEGKGVFVVAKDAKHQEQLKGMIIQKTDLGEKDIFLIGKGQSVYLTDDSVKKKKTPDYKVVITTVRHSEGYTLTRLSAMVTSVYPSNNATRVQLHGRIDRIGQAAKTIYYVTVHCGILSYILEKHNEAKTLSAILDAIADDVTILE